MPLFSEHIANMYYGSSSPYTGLPYSYGSSVSPLGSSYSASYLNPGGSYSNHSSLGSYSRAPLSSRWITSAGRNYYPMLTPISERGSPSPARINSPRRIPLSTRTYGTPTYTPRPVNINTADIDVSKNKYKHRVEPSVLPKPDPPELKESSTTDGPFMPRVDGKPETGIDSSPGEPRGTIKRGRTVVRLYTIKRNSPRKPTEDSDTPDVTRGQEIEPNEDIKTDEKEFMKWREKLSDDLTYKEKREKKTLGAKLVEKFIVKDSNEDLEVPIKLQKKETSQSLPATPAPNVNLTETNCFDRRCSIELLAEQANLLDSLIRSENLSTATLDLSKVGTAPDPKNNLATFESMKRRRQNLQNPLKTTKSDHSLYDNLKSYKDVRDPKNLSKRRSIKKSSSGSSLRRLDSITEFPKEPPNVNLPAIEENRLSDKQAPKEKPKPKLKTKITTSVEISPPKSPLKFKVENVTVEEKPRKPKKEITYSSEVVETKTEAQPCSTITEGGIKIMKKKNKKKGSNDLESPESEDGNFWDKIGKRETVYLMKRKQFLEEVKEKHKRALFWFPEEEEGNKAEDTDDTNKSNTNLDVVTSVLVNQSKQLTGIDEGETKLPIQSFNSSKIIIADQSDIGASASINEISHKQKDDVEKQLGSEEESVNKNIPELALDITTTIARDGSKSNQENKVDSGTTTTCKVNNVSKSLGKSASLDDIDENKVKKTSQKKTKSENSKQIFKTKEKAVLKPLQTQLPKSNNKTDFKAKNESSEKPKDLCQKCMQLEQKETPLEVRLNNNQVEDSSKKDVSTEISIQNQTNEPDIKDANTAEISKAGNVCRKDLPVVEAEENDEGLKTNTDILMPASKPLNSSITDVTSEIVEEKVTANVSELKVLDVNKNSQNTSKIKPDNNKSATLNSSDVTVNTILNPALIQSTSMDDNLTINNIIPKIADKKVPNLNHNIKTPVNNMLPSKLKASASSESSNVVPKNGKPDTKVLKESVIPLRSVEPSLQPATLTSEESTTTNQQKTGIDSSLIDPNLNDETKSLNVPVVPIVRDTQDIPNKEHEIKIEVREQKTGEENKAENMIKKDEEVEKLTIIKRDEEPETSTQDVTKPIPTPSPKRPVKEEKALKPLIATPRPLQKKAPQVIHSSDSSDSSSEEESSEEEEEDESDASEDSAEFFECENHPDGRTSTGSNDSGFDSSAPASPATFSQIKKGGEASGTSASAAPANPSNTDILEQQLEQSTAYDIFKKTGRFTPPARSIPRFRKYTVEDFQFIKVLGKGSFGKVLLAELRDTEYYYAVKCLKKDVVLEDDDVECTLIERKVLALGTNHPYLCHLFATFQTDSHLFFVMEYLNGGDLMFHIQQSGRFPEARARFYAAEIVSGLKFLHKRGIVYRDLKLDNILLDFEGHVRIADFGMCKLQIYLEKTADTFCGTPDYMAPEIIKGLKYNQTVDWWSFGVLLYEMLIGQSPFSGCDEDELFWSICNEMPSYPRFLSQESLTILTRLLDKDARTRLGGTECMHGDIREQDFFHAIHWDRLERRELDAPFRPRVRHPMDTQYFDRAFTGERPRLTAVEPHVLRSMDQEPFRGFSYTNPNTTDR